MANRLKGGIKGAIGLVMGLVATVLLWYWVSPLNDIIQIDIMRAFFWVGLLLTWILAVFVKPIQIFMGGKQSLSGSVKGIITFLVGFIISMVLYYVGPQLIEVMGGIFNSSTLNSLGWFLLIILWAILMVIAPAYTTIKDTIE